MTTRMKFEFKGVDDLTRRMKLVGDEMATKAGQSAVRAAAEVVADEAKAFAPRSDDGNRSPMSETYGHLVDNIKVRKGRSRKQHTVVSTITTGNSFWGRFLEYGTSKLAAQPWFKPAFDSAAPKALAKLEEQLGKALDRTIKKFGGR